MRCLLLSLSCFSLLAVSVPAGAQYVASPSSQKISNCPIGFRAHVNGRAKARTIADKKKSPTAWMLEMSFEGRDQPKLVSAVVMVYGTSSSNHSLPLGERWELGNAKSQTFELRSKAELQHAEIWVTQVPFVSWAELREMRFSDGRVWRLSFESECKARVGFPWLTYATEMPR